MGRSALPRGRALLLTETGSIHMMFMRFSIDAVFLDVEKRVVAIRENLRPWLGLAAAPSDCVLELPAGMVRELGIRVEDRILLRSTACNS